MSHNDELDLGRLARDCMQFRRRVVELAAGEDLAFEPAAWRDAVVFVAAGEVELECRGGERRRFGMGAVICFAPPVSVCRNCGADVARLIAISRRRHGSAKRTG